MNDSEPRVHVPPIARMLNDLVNIPTLAQEEFDFLVRLSGLMRDTWTSEDLNSLEDLWLKYF